MKRTFKIYVEASVLVDFECKPGETEKQARLRLIETYNNFGGVDISFAPNTEGVVVARSAQQVQDSLEVEAV